MNRWISTIAAAVMLLAIGGCGGMEGVRGYWTLQQSDFLQLKPGMTKPDIERMIGKPVALQTFARLSEEVWSYQWLDTQIRMWANLHFDLGGKLKYYHLIYDHAYYSPDP